MVTDFERTGYTVSRVPGIEYGDMYSFSISLPSEVIE